MNTVKLVVLISGSGTNLQAIIEAIEKGLVHAEISAVISNRPDVRGLARARDQHIATEVIDHKQFTDRHRFDQALLEAIESYQPDLVILAGFMRILTDRFVTHFHGKMLNIHPSLLPKYKGLNTHARAIEAAESEHGCSVHFVNNELDSGAVIGQFKVPLRMNDTVETLSKRVQIAEHKLYLACIELLCQKRIQLTPEGVEHRGQLLPDSGLDLTED